MGRYSTHNINKVYLMLQGDIKAQEPTEEVYQYLERLIKIRPSYAKPLAITFWGSEPLIHTEIMKKVIARLGDKPKYGRVTNGALLLPDSYYDIPLKEYDEKLRWLAGEALTDMITLKQTQAVMFFKQHVNRLLSGRTYAAKYGYPYFDLNIDCNGYHYICRNNGERIGHISEDRIVLVERMDKWLAEHTNEKCKTCEVYPICYDGCSLEYKEKTCAINRVFYKVCMDLANAFLNNYERISLEV